jgi:uncharacterized paraquat-inducible protein A
MSEVWSATADQPDLLICSDCSRLQEERSEDRCVRCGAVTLFLSRDEEREMLTLLRARQAEREALALQAHREKAER